jgi:hypothetical protein
MMPWWVWLVSAFCLFVFQMIVGEASKPNQNSRTLKFVRVLLIAAMVLALVVGAMRLISPRGSTT